MRPVQLMAACAASFACIAVADDGPPAAAVANLPALTRSDVESWLDGFMPYALRHGDVAGAVVVVVKDGEVLTQRGYGYADVAAHEPVDPARTLFRPGSVSKLYTWTAVMQLVERGLVDLDADVNDYLDFRIPQRYGKAITLRNLMTHTAGFEEQYKDLMGVESDDMWSFEAYLKRWTPERIFPPGGTPAYSNYGSALAAYVVTRVSHLSFDDYIEQHVLEPLGMRNATFRQPLPERLRPQMSRGYATASAPPRPFEVVSLAPAGSLSASGGDMARFMIAHLQDGRYGSQQILRPETARQMHSHALTILPGVDRMLLGFYETNVNGRRVISHGGNTQWFHSYLHLFIDDGVGLFVSLNSSGVGHTADDIRAALFENFADRYLPGETRDGRVETAVATAHARMIAGRYESSRRMETSFVSLLNLLGELEVIDNGDGTIGLSAVTSPAGVPLKWREIAPFLWRQVGGRQLLAAEVDGGRVARFSYEGVSPYMMFEPPPVWRAASWLLPLLVASLAALVFTSIAWPVGALTRRHYGARLALAAPDARSRRWVLVAAVAVVIVWLAWAATLVAMTSDSGLFAARLDGWIWVLQIAAAVVFAGGAAIGLWNAWVAGRGQRRWPAKLWSLVLAVSFLTVLWVALAYRMIALDVNY